MRAGVSSIEHGSFLDVEGANMEKATFVMKNGAVYKTPAVALHP